MEWDLFSRSWHGDQCWPGILLLQDSTLVGCQVIIKQTWKDIPCHNIISLHCNDDLKTLLRYQNFMKENLYGNIMQFLTRLMVVAVACDTVVNMITSVPSITSHPLPLLNRVVLVFGLWWYLASSEGNKGGPCQASAELNYKKGRSKVNKKLVKSAT